MDSISPTDRTCTPNGIRERILMAWEAGFAFIIDWWDDTARHVARTLQDVLTIRDASA